MSDIQRQLLDIVRLMVDAPQGARVEEIDTGRSRIFEVSVEEDDLGKVIGRQGRTARALRALIATRGLQDNDIYELDIVEE